MIGCSALLRPRTTRRPRSRARTNEPLPLPRSISGSAVEGPGPKPPCCRDSTLAKEGVQEEIGIASDLVKALKDPKFIIPLRLEPYKKLFGIGELQHIDFVRGWAEGLAKLLATPDLNSALEKVE